MLNYQQMVQKGIVKEWYVSKQTMFVAYDIILNVDHHKSIQYATENISHITPENDKQQMEYIAQEIEKKHASPVCP